MAVIAVIARPICQIGVAMVRFVAGLLSAGVVAMSWRGRAIAAAVAVAISVAMAPATYVSAARQIGFLPLATVAAIATAIAWFRRRRAAAATRQVATPSPAALPPTTLAILTAVVAENVAPPVVLAHLATSLADGWRREVAEITATLDRLAESSSSSAHLTFAQEFGRLRSADRRSWQLAAAHARIPHRSRPELRRIGRQTAGGPAVALLLSILIDGKAPAQALAVALAQVESQGWRRQAAEIRATAEAVVAADVANLAFGADLVAAEGAQGVWRPAWMGGTVEPALAGAES